MARLAFFREYRVKATHQRLRSTVLALVVAGGLATPAWAQPVQFGVEAGAAFTTFVGRDADAAKRRTGPFGGVTVMVQKPGALLGFQSGLTLISKGVSVDEEGVSGSFRLRYLEVPLLLRIGKAANGSGIIPAITAGATVGARIGCTISASGDGISGELDCDSEILGQRVDFNRFEAGVALGAEVAFPYRKRLLIVPMVRYTRGLTKIGDSGSEDDIRNEVIQLGIGIRFRR